MEDNNNNKTSLPAAAADEETMTKKITTTQTPSVAGGDIEGGASAMLSPNNDTTHDAVFGDCTTGEGPNYRNVGWVGTTALMMKTQLGLGILSMPGNFDVLGLIPGIICLLVVGAITTWSNHMVGVFKRKHPQVYGIDDAGYIMFGRVGREFLGGAYIIYYIFVTGSAILSVSTAFNALSHHAACTAVFVAVAAVIGFLFSSIRTLDRIAWLAWVGVTCIVTSVIVVTIVVGLQDRPASAPQTGPWTSDYKLFNNPDFASGMSAVASMVFSYGGTPAFFALASEMRDPERYYGRSLAICQSLVTAIYVTVGCVVYYFCGSYVASPALGSAGPLFKTVAYGIAFPGLIATNILLSHLPSKSLFVRLLRGSDHLTSNSVTHWTVWIGCTLTVSLAAYLIASGIPIFSSLVSLVGALLSCVLSVQPMGCMWLYDNWTRGKTERSPRWLAMVVWSVFVIIVGCVISVGGTYGAVINIINVQKASSGEGGAWSCADNSNS